MAKLPEQLLLNFSPKGLVTHPNTISEAQPGGLARAENVVITRPSTLSSRRGVGPYGSDSVAVAVTQRALHQYQGVLLMHVDDMVWFDSTQDGNTWVNLNNNPSPFDRIDPPIDSAEVDATYPETVSIRTEEANNNLYMTSREGILRFDTFSGALLRAGGLQVRSLDAEQTGGSGFLASGSSVAYRAVIVLTDFSNNDIVGPVSERMVVTASASARDVIVTVYYDPQIAAGVHHLDRFRIQIYRTNSTTAGIEPDEEFQLVKEITSDEIIAGAGYGADPPYFSFTDATDESFLGAALYTSPSQAGIESNNVPPPWALDITTHRGFTLYSNVQTRHTMDLQLLSVGAPNGIQVDDTITIGNSTIGFTVYTGKATENITARQFEVVTSGTPATNIAATARSLARVISCSSSQIASPAEFDRLAYYNSGVGDQPGKILILERVAGPGSDFDASSSHGGWIFRSSRGAAFQPQLPAASDDITSTNEVKPHRIYISRFQQPDAVPIESFIDIGSRAFPIQRVLPLRDSVIVLKQDGVYRVLLSGEIPDVQLIDSTTSSFVTKTATVVNNQVIVMADQGVVSITDAKVGVLSYEIESEILQLREIDTFDSEAFAFAYESERLYIMFVPNQTGESPSAAYVYNFITKSWTTWRFDNLVSVSVGRDTMRAGLVLKSDNKMYLLPAATQPAAPIQERKDRSPYDYADDELDITIAAQTQDVAADTTTLTITGIEDFANIGDVIQQDIGGGALIRGRISEVTDDTVVIEDIVSFNLGDAVLFKSILCDVEFVPQHGNSPTVLKHFREVTFVFRDAPFQSATVLWSSNYYGGGVYEESTIEPVILSGAWGLFEWGLAEWGGSPFDKQSIRTFVPLESSRAQWLKIRMRFRQAFTSFDLEGFSMLVMSYSTRQK